MVFVLVACSPSTETGTSEPTKSEETVVASEPASEPASAEPQKIGMLMNFAHPYFDAINDGIKDVIEPLGYELVVINGEYDVQKQIGDLEDLITQKCVGIFIEPVDGQALLPGINAAMDANIPIISVDTGIQNIDWVTADVQTDNIGAGKMIANDCVKKLGEKGNVVLLTAPLVAATADRGTGIKEVLANYPDIKIIAEQAYDCDQAKALDIMENVIQANEQIDAVLTINEDGAISAISALEAAGRLEGVFIYTVNGSQAECTLIEQGKLTGTAAQRPYLNGQTAAQVMVEALKGNPIEKQTLTEPYWLDINNLDSYTPVY
jgi:ribose transport system substrate-binding protein